MYATTQLSVSLSSMTIGFPYVPEIECILSEWDGRERPDRLKSLGVVCKTMGVTGNVAAVHEERDEGDPEGLCERLSDAIKPCFGGQRISASMES